MKFKIKTTSKDLGAAFALEQMGYAKGKSHVDVGIQSDKGAIQPVDPETGKASSLNLAQIAAVNEFGATGAGRNKSVTIPERSFMRSTMETHKNEIHNYASGQLLLALSGKSNAPQAFKRIGIYIESLIKRTITNLRTPPNAPSTIKGKGSSNPLIDTGRMRSSIASKVHLRKRKV